MRESIRLYGTLVVWFFFTALTTALFTIPSSVFSDASAGVALAVLITLAVTTMMSTMGIWGQLNSSESASENTLHAAGKPKRMVQDRRLTRLVDTLDENEVDALAALLAEREDELQRRSTH